MVSLEELVSLVTRGAPGGAVSQRRGGSDGTDGDAVAEGKGHDVGNTAEETKSSVRVEEAKKQREVGSNSDDTAADAKEGEARTATGRVGGGGVEEQKEHKRPQEQRQQQNQQAAVGTNGAADRDSDPADGGVDAATRTAVGISRGATAATATSATAAGVSTPSAAGSATSSWFRDRPAEDGGSGGGDGTGAGEGDASEGPLPSRVRWTFMWLLDSVFFSVKEPVEGLDRHPAVHALLENLLAVRACVRACMRMRARQKKTCNAVSIFFYYLHETFFICFIHLSGQCRFFFLAGGDSAGFCQDAAANAP